jgi:hypothetical protein
MVKTPRLLWTLMVMGGLGCAAVQAVEQDNQRAMQEYCQTVAEKADSNGAQKTQLLEECIQEQKAMLQQRDVVGEFEGGDVSPQLLERCYHQADRWFQKQRDAGNDTVPEYDILLEKCVRNQGVLKP